MSSTNSKSSSSKAARRPSSTRRVSSHGRKAKGGGADVITLCTSDCKYDCVKDAARARGWRLVEGSGPESRKANMFWVDVSCIGERMRELEPWQRINHFPGMSGIARKARMAQALDRMRRRFPADYNFYPRTWVLPAEWSSFRTEFDAQGHSSRTFIIKPDAGCQGKGIFLTQDLDRLSPMESQVAQLYVRKPLLIDNLKFDLRVYVLVTSIRPLRVYMFQDGLARFCTEEYSRPSSDNLGDKRMHLTNYAINKGSENFVANEHRDHDHTGSKRSLRWLLKWVGEKFGQERARSVRRRMGSAVVKTIIAGLPQLHRDYRSVFGEETFASHGQDASRAARATWAEMEKGNAHPETPTSVREVPIEGSRCIEILGFDFMIDSSLKPWLIEVNHLPSFATDSPLDDSIKTRVISTALATVRVKSTDRASHEATQKRGCHARLYPSFPAASSLPQGKSAAGIEGNSARLNVIRSEVEEIYRERAPDKHGKLGALFRRYEGKEEKLLLLVKKKYCATSNGEINAQADACADETKADAQARSSDDVSSCGSSGSSDSTSYKSSMGGQVTSDTIGRSHERATGERSQGHGGSIAPSNGDASPLKRPERSKVALSDGDESDIWEEDEDPEVLGWEMSQLEGWDRLWPTQGGVEGGLEMGGAEVDTEAENLSIPLPLHSRTYQRIPDIMKYAFEEDQKSFLRLYAPLHQQRGELDPRLPGVQGMRESNPGAYCGPSLWTRAQGGGGLVMGKAPARIEKPPLPVPGPEQQAVADRLCRGYSSKKFSDEGEYPESEPPLAAAVQAASLRAREWQQRLENARQRKASAVQAVKVNTLYFDMSAMLSDL